MIRFIICLAVCCMEGGGSFCAEPLLVPIIYRLASDDNSTHFSLIISNTTEKTLKFDPVYVYYAVENVSFMAMNPFGKRLEFWRYEDDRERYYDEMDIVLRPFEKTNLYFSVDKRLDGAKVGDHVMWQVNDAVDVVVGTNCCRARISGKGNCILENGINVNVVLEIAKKHMLEHYERRSEEALYTLSYLTSKGAWEVFVEFVPRKPGGHLTLEISSSGRVVREIPGL